MAVILALDIATKTGWAHDGPEPGRPLTGTFRAPSPEGDAECGFDFGRTFAGYRQWLVRMIGIVKPATVAFEAPLQIVQGQRSKVATNQNTIRILFGLAAITEMAITECGLRAYEANVQAVKRHFAGHGHADKAAMLGRCRQLGWAAEDHNAADAAALWSLVKSLQEPQWSPNSTPLFGRRAG